MESSMEKERFLLRKLGQEERADFLYQQRGIIKKHILNAEEIIFDTDEDISCVRNFIEERYRLHFGLDRDGHPRELSEEEKKERDFLLDNSMFITRVILRMHNLEPDDYIAICVSDMIAAMSIHTKPYERVRASSPPRHDFSEDGPLIELPWSDEGEMGNDEILESEDVEVKKAMQPKLKFQAVDTTQSESADGDEKKHEILFDWSEDIFPDDDNAVVGEKRPLDVLDILDLPLKRRAVERDGFVEQKPMETTPPPLQLRSCLRYHEEILTDVNEDQLPVKERIKWREAFESHSAKKKSVHFAGNALLFRYTVMSLLF
ncbi:unnamed protein product [Strongylus vulgaris]|uniref:Uncharacterized protein n=1 Tax=Strongylus vulgaris TaxID=40348 RepID=A0A3P7JXH8_STRVU|nr:unnamed protein product [Strongylus vulgaris]